MLNATSIPKRVTALAMSAVLAVSLIPLAPHTANAEELTSGTIAEETPVEKIDISKASVTPYKSDGAGDDYRIYSDHVSTYFEYTGSKIKPDILLEITKPDGAKVSYATSIAEDRTESYWPYPQYKGLPSNSFKVTYKNNVNAGTASVTITGKGNYTGSVTKKFTIHKAAAMTYLFKKYPKKMKAWAKKIASYKVTKSNTTFRKDGFAVTKLPALPKVGLKMSYVSGTGAILKQEAINTGTYTYRPFRYVGMYKNIETLYKKGLVSKKAYNVYKKKEKALKKKYKNNPSVLKSELQMLKAGDRTYESVNTKKGTITTLTSDLSLSMNSKGRTVGGGVLVKGNKNLYSSFFGNGVAYDPVTGADWSDKYYNSEDLTDPTHIGLGFRLKM